MYMDQGAILVLLEQWSHGKVSGCGRDNQSASDAKHNRNENSATVHI
jgi:hypothetical protein